MTAPANAPANQGPPPSAALMQILSARWVAHSIGAAAEFRLADHLAGGPLASTEIARRAGTHAEATQRLLRALASHGIFKETEPGTFANTPSSEVLRSDVPGSMHAMVVYSFAQHTAEAWASLPKAVASGESAFRHAHGMGTWDFLKAHPDAAATFDAAMTSNSRHEAAGILGAYDFGRFETLVDVAGGAGFLLTSVLAKHAALRGVLFDLPHAIEHARPLVAASPAADRCQLVAGSAFDGVPAGADAYMMKHILHDWSDAESLRFLGSIHEAARPGATLLVCEAVIEPGNGAQWAKLLDINMLVMTEGRERTEAEFADLLRRGGFALERVVRTPGPICVLEARKT